jgi:hypothetical protein
MRVVIISLFILGFSNGLIAQEDTLKKSKHLLLYDTVGFENKSNERLMIGKGEKNNDSIVVVNQKKTAKGIIKDPNNEDTQISRIQGPSRYDSRIELRKLLPLNETWKEKIISNSLSVGIIMERSMLSQIDDSLWQLDVSTTLGKRFNLCSNEAFYQQPVVGFGTAFLIDEETMLTAAHVFDLPYQDLVVVFGFDLKNPNGQYEQVFKSSDIYSIKTIEQFSLDLDVAKFKLDRAADRIGLTVSTSQPLKEDIPVYMIGHPSGLPKKIALNAEITTCTNPYYFFTSLDAFQGNSGSPVFNFETHELIGVLVSGNSDYRWNGQCFETTLFTKEQTEGEKVIRIETILHEFQE